MKHNTFARKQRQLKSLIKELQVLLADQNKNATAHVNRLILKIRRLFNELICVINRVDYKKTLGAAATIIGISITNQVAAQSFAAPVENPFGLVPTYHLAFPTFADLDGDGDMDLLVGEAYGVMQYFENIGTANSPLFAAPVENPFGLVSSYGLGFPTFVDLDGDGDMDLLIGEYYGVMQYFENIGTANIPLFAAPVENPFGLVSTYEIAIPTFVDIDGDGDMDLLVGEAYGVMQYFENIGTANSPLFATPVENPFGLVSSYGLAFPVFADLDGDGDMDLLVGEYYGVMQYFENTGTANSPIFAAPQANPFGLVSTYEFAFPAFVDLDGDGDIDLMVGEYYGALQYFEHFSTAGIAKLAENLNLKLFPNPVQDELHIESDEKIEKVEIIDVTGKTIAKFENTTHSISLKNLSPGQYNVKITFEKGNYTVRQVQKH